MIINQTYIKKPRYLYLVASLTSVYWAIKSNGSQLGHKPWAECETVRNEELKMNNKYMKRLLDQFVGSTL